MKVAFLTPLHERSAIGGVSLRVIEAVGHRWDVDIWYPACDRPRYTTLTTVPFRDGKAAARQLEQYDLAVYVMGDSPQHLEILAAARRHPGLVILHDRSLIHLFEAYDHETGNDLLGIVAALADAPEVAKGLADYRMGIGGTLTDLAEMLPMIHVALHHSLGVLTHSQHTARDVSRLTAGSVHVAPLPLLHDVAVGSTPRSGDEFVLVVAGMVNPNKCVERLIKAVAASEILSDRVRVRVVGLVTVEQRSRLLALAEQVGLTHRVELTGSLPLNQFEAALDHAAAFACLRDPVLEAASASLLEEMARGRPVLVYDHGHYGDLPDDVVVKVDVNAGQVALVSALESLVADPHRSSAIGELGRRYVLTKHTARAYADALLDAGAAALHAQLLVNGIRNLGRDLSEMGLSRDDYARSSAAAAVAELFLSDDSAGGHG